MQDILLEIDCQSCSSHISVHCVVTETLTVRNGFVIAGGVFEEAILSASFFLAPGTQIVETVRNGFVIDNVFEVRHNSHLRIRV